MTSMTTKKTSSRSAGWHVPGNPSSKALPAGKRVTETQHGLNTGTKSNDAGKQRTDGGKPNGSIRGRAATPAVSTGTESPMTMEARARKLYPSAK